MKFAYKLIQDFQGSLHNFIVMFEYGDEEPAGNVVLLYKKNQLDNPKECLTQSRKVRREKTLKVFKHRLNSEKLLLASSRLCVTE